jgi:putative oxidoreductase
MAIGLLILRVALGAIMAAHGVQKLFGWFGGPGVERTTGMATALGFRPARFHAWLVGLAESIGGVLVALGLLTPLGAAAIAGVMLVAIPTVHWSKGFFTGNGGYEFNLLIAAAAVALGFTGPGIVSVDHLIGWTIWGTWWGVGTAALGLAAAGSVLAARRPQGPALGGAQGEERRTAA